MQGLARPEWADLAPLAHNLSTSLSSCVRTRLLQRQTHRPRLQIGLFSAVDPLTVNPMSRLMQTIEQSVLPAPPATSEQSWRQLRQRLLRHARMMVFEPAQAEDLVQESLIAVLEKPDAHRGDSTLVTWGIAILKHKIADWYRSPHQQRRVWNQTEEAEPANESSDDLYDEQGSYKEAVPSWQQPEKHEAQRQMMSVMETCLKHLPAQTRRVFMMREWLGFETTESCERLSLSADNCRMVLHRARMGLRSCMTSHGHTTGIIQ